MAFEEVQQLIDLLAVSPGITELTVQGSAGDRVTIKRALSSLPVLQEAADQSPYSEDPEPSVELSTPPVSINATMVGLFHETTPPVVTGTSISSGQIVGYIESMRLMNEVVSTVEGTVDVVIISDGQPVEYGQPLFALNSK